MIFYTFDKPFPEELEEFFERESCTPKRKEECKRNSGPFLKELCAACKVKKEGEPNPYFAMLSQMFMLTEAGYTFQNDDLSFQTWNDFALFRYFSKAKIQPFG